MNDIAAEQLECVVRDTGPDPKHAVIWLHGLGADGHDFEPIVPHLSVASSRPVRFVFPHAPVMPVTINGGMAMRAWYDILGVDIDRNQDGDGILRSVAATNRLIDSQLQAGISPERLILAGFSQGGAIALRCGLARTEPLGGVIGLSTYLLGEDSLDEWLGEAARQVPVFMGHGTQDPIVPVALGQSSAERLKSAGFDVTWQTWPMQHAVCQEEIAAIDHWLTSTWN
ncbi:carboxylesterase [Wenzhouxiangella sp. AB-CW3]|uniref:alpha/beta hydrolase n=1 Tax=Wenzhouxiangella sp. AB-CW3 TaxID=2771012 RepID=UPI00168AE9BA|nr:carboxylesterase [Wenzhouxiangella sp. AB-CW3]QOC23650.1 carboxylesterase [Wenzhouxiangella sp. AB-CW3]